ncbi:hypothetical protein C6N75_07505 [Streptomyces solincola]|uniref:Secreted protein n=2 Tax=Streptomyces solincola TaxID=2100817 RepID=A0A2S9PZI7_9ACTN|nr:hypothetical protein C6N75_07505 [Streptomyces solincola]
MTLIRTAVAGSALLGTLGLGVASPALAADNPREQATDTLTITSTTTTGDGAVKHVDFSVDGTRVMQHHYVTDGFGVDYFSETRLSRTQAAEVQRLARSKALASEQWTLVSVNCAPGEKTTWDVKAGDVEVSTASCNGALPVLPKTASRIVKLVASASQG